MVRDFVISRVGGRPWIAIDHRMPSSNHRPPPRQMRFPVPDDLQKYSDAYLLDVLRRVIGT